MAELLYFFPGRDSIDLDGIAAEGLGYAFGKRAELSTRNVGDGPGGVGGVVACDGTRVPTECRGYYPDRQKWVAVPGKRDADKAASRPFVGCFTNEHAPKPADLLRTDAIAGDAVELADGNEWTAPIARGFSSADDELIPQSKLATALTINDDGDWIESDVVPKHQRLWTIAEKFWDAWVQFCNSLESSGGTTGELAIPETELRDDALRVLATNYHVGKAEARLLGLFDVDTAVEILLALVDWSTVKKWMEKKTT